MRHRTTCENGFNNFVFINLNLFLLTLKHQTEKNFEVSKIVSQTKSLELEKQLLNQKMKSS